MSSCFLWAQFTFWYPKNQNQILTPYKSQPSSHTHEIELLVRGYGRVWVLVLGVARSHFGTASPIWGDIFESSSKAQSSKLERLFSLKCGKRDVWALSFELWNRIRKCHPKWDERWGAGVETQKNVRGEIGGWGRVPFNEPYAPSLSTIYDGA